jgi:hypothetical protein
MPAGTWKLYNQAKHYIGNATINLGSATFDLHLYQTTTAFGTRTLSTYTSLVNANQVASANNYTQAGKPLTAVVWTSNGAASAGQQRFSSAALTFTATTGNIANVKGAVIVVRGASARAATNKLLCYSTLTATAFAIAQNNTLTITMNAAGIFTLA